MLTNIEPGGQAQAGPPWEAVGSGGSGKRWEEDWVGEELVGGVEGVARKEGWEDEQLEKAPGEGKCTKRRLTTFRKRGAARQQSSRDQVSGALHRPALLQCAEQVGRARAATIPRALHSLRLENPRPELTALPAWLLANLSISHLVVARSRVSQERNRKKWIYSAIDLHREKYFGY